MKRVLGTLLLSLLAACGGLSDKESIGVWAALEAAGVAQPVSLAMFEAGGVFAAPVQCQSGQAVSSVLQTHAFAPLQGGGVDGSASGMVTYDLRSCKVDAQPLALQGAVHRSFHGAARAAQAVDHERIDAMQRWTDHVQGTLSLRGQVEGTCHVDVTRSLSDAAVVYEGTLCDHPAAELLRDRRPAGGPQ